MNGTTNDWKCFESLPSILHTKLQVKYKTCSSLSTLISLLHLHWECHLQQLKTKTTNKNLTHFHPLKQSINQVGSLYSNLSYIIMIIKFSTKFKLTFYEVSLVFIYCMSSLQNQVQYERKRYIYNAVFVNLCLAQEKT